MIVSFTFDDARASQYSALSVFDAHDMRATFYVNTGTVGTSEPPDLGTAASVLSRRARDRRPHGQPRTADRHRRGHGPGGDPRRHHHPASPRIPPPGLLRLSLRLPRAGRAAVRQGSGVRLRPDHRHLPEGVQPTGERVCVADTPREPRRLRGPGGAEEGRHRCRGSSRQDPPRLPAARLLLPDRRGDRRVPCLAATACRQRNRRQDRRRGTTGDSPEWEPAAGRGRRTGPDGAGRLHRAARRARAAPTSTATR